VTVINTLKVPAFVSEPQMAGCETRTQPKRVGTFENVKPGGSDEPTCAFQAHK